MAATTVLIVDDEHYIVDLLADLLEEEGYEVRRAYDGLMALEAVERNMPDLIIADVMMPRLDGISLISRVHEQNPKLPVILMSAATVDPGRPGIRFIAKPFDIDYVLNTVAQAIL